MAGPDRVGGGEVEVSIVIPCFNRAGLVGEAIASALAQEGSTEVIVVDDGSTDDSWSVIQGYGSRIRAFRTGNRGVSAARNFGMKEARGAFIRFLDSDDRIPAGALAAHLAEARRLGDGLIAVGDARPIDAAGEPVAGRRYGYAAVAPPGPIAPAVLIGTIMPPWLPLFPAGALRRSGGFDERLGLIEDHELALRLARAGNVFVRIPIPVTEVREHGFGRLSRGLGRSGHAGLAASFETIWQGLRETDPGPAERAALGRMVWRAGRNAARRGFAAEAAPLFGLARSIAGAEAVNASPAFRLLYRLFPPYRAERVGEAIKRLIRR